MEMQYAIWIYKEFKHEPGAHFAPSLFDERVYLAPTHHKAVQFFIVNYTGLGWRHDIIPITSDSSLEFWTDRFRGRLETGQHNRISKEA